jgi:hypothetical protein
LDETTCASSASQRWFQDLQNRLTLQLIRTRVKNTLLKVRINAMEIQELVQALAALPAATLYEGMGKVGAIHRR